MKLFKSLFLVSIFAVVSIVSYAKEARFNWVEYEGTDEVYKQKLKKDHYWNPVVAGYYPDPSVVRAGNDYYLVNSSFAFFPGLPIFHSTDLVNWKQIGNALNRRSQLKFENGQGMSRGIFAPTIRHHDGTFYIITTDVDGIGNFIISAKNPAGPWSDPIQLPEVGGIDPDLFFDDDGKVYIAHNDAPEGTPLYEGHRAIWLWEFDLAKKKVVEGTRRLIINGGVDLSKKPIWIEGPHIYKVNGWYYLSCAEGGTSLNHSQVVFRTKSLNEPFVPSKNNPILTQRDLDPQRQNPVTSVGHVDFVQTPQGDWWAVFLGIRPYYDDEAKDWFHNTGRETFLLPVDWEEWPTILPSKVAVPLQLKAPKLKNKNKIVVPQNGNFKWRDNFESLNIAWTRLRTSAENWHEIDAKHKQLVLKARPIRLSEKLQPSALVRRQQHLNFKAGAELELPSEGVQAGLTLFQNSDYHYFFYIEKEGDFYRLSLEETFDGKSETKQIQTLKLDQNVVTLGFEQNGDALSFYFLDQQGEEQVFINEISASKLSTQIAGGFIGVTFGPHARTSLK